MELFLRSSVKKAECAPEVLLNTLTSLKYLMCLTGHFGAKFGKKLRRKILAFNRLTLKTSWDISAQSYRHSRGVGGDESRSGPPGYPAGT